MNQKMYLTEHLALPSERSKKGTYWVHFAVRAEGNRRKVAFMRG